MAFGITVKGRWASFGNNPNGGENQVSGNGKGFAVDFGYMIYVNKNLRLGIMLRDLINKFSWNSSVSGNYNEGVAATLRFGGANTLDGVIVAFDFRKTLPNDTANRAYIGLERVLFESLVL